ncbi:MAG: hypothetical protein RL417_899 [Pseudomonadota bacterium]|jgi:hypothetical protein
MHGSITFSRTLIPWGFTARIELLIPTPRGGLGDLYTEIVRELLPPGALIGETITDRKGRAASVVLDQATPASALPRGEEILFVAGRTPTPDEELPEITPENLSEPFDLSIVSSFEQFVGDHHIAHRTTVERRGAFAEILDIPAIGRLWPLVIDRLRFGIEYFRSHRSGIFGYTPTVERTLLIDADGADIRVVFEHERLTARSPEQLLADDAVQALTTVIARGTGANLDAFIRSAR